MTLSFRSKIFGEKIPYEIFFSNWVRNSCLLQNKIKSLRVSNQGEKERKRKGV